MGVDEWWFISIKDLMGVLLALFPNINIKIKYFQLYDSSEGKKYLFITLILLGIYYSLYKIFLKSLLSCNSIENLVLKRWAIFNNEFNKER